jgi:methylthioribulose-1-phosphate dehydratase
MEAQLRTGLVELIHSIHRRGWSPGTGGNFSALLARAPFRLLITPSGVDKGRVTADELLEVGPQGERLGGHGKPSAETLLHVAVVTTTAARVVLHTHSIWNTLASLQPTAADPPRYELHGYEMLKGLCGVTTHEHREVVPILANSQDIPALQLELCRVLAAQPATHAVLIAGHGLYTWGQDLAEAQRHLEVLEFLFEVALRRG